MSFQNILIRNCYALLFFYLSIDKLARKIHLFGRLYVRVGHGNFAPLYKKNSIKLT